MTIDVEDLRRVLDGATPGPWEVETGVIPIGDTGDYDPYVSVISPERTRIYDVYSEEDQDEANARLIAMAPDLAREYLALREAAGKLAERLNDWSNDHLTDEAARDWFGHVEPALANLRAILGDDQ
jgi:hypothetical protein